MRLNETLLSTVGGPLLEHVGLELIQKATYMGMGYRASFWRTVSGSAVHFILETPEEDVATEVRWTDMPTDRDARHVKKFIDLNPERAKRSYVVCRVPQAQE